MIAALLFILAAPAVAVEFKQADAFWSRLEQAGPDFSKPIRLELAARPFEGHEANLYGLLFPVKDFVDLWQFQLFVIYTSSLHQELVWAHRERRKTDYSRFSAQNRVVALQDVSALEGSWAQLRKPSDVKSRLASMPLPASFRWVLDLNIQDAYFEEGEGTFEMVARAREGYLVLFSVVD